jgi:hypothetical protein
LKTSLSPSIILPSVHEIQTVGVSPLTSRAESAESSHLLMTTKNNYSQYSLSNKIILSVLRCLEHLCKLNFDWKELQNGKDEIKKSYRCHHHLVASNPMTELASVSALLILPLLSQSQVSLFYNIPFTLPHALVCHGSRSNECIDSCSTKVCQ